MATIIAKFSDYAIQSVEYFIDAIEDEIDFRDLKGLIANNRVQKVQVTKQHPLVTLMAAQFQTNRNLDELRSSILPAISVTPGSLTEDGFTLGQGFQTELVDDAFILELQALLNKTDKEIAEDCLITKDQINLIISEYRRRGVGGTRVQRHKWYKTEELNVSVWSDSPDLDIIISNIMESLLADLQVGFAGDDSKVQNMKFKPTRGLTNFNFGRVLFGTEYSLTFLNTYNNYTIYYDDVITGHEFHGTFESPGE